MDPGSETAPRMLAASASAGVTRNPGNLNDPIKHPVRLMIIWGTCYRVRMLP